MDIIDEIKHEISEENLHKFIKKYTPFIIGLMIAVIIGITAGLAWKNYRSDQIAKDGGQYMSAILKMKSHKADEAISIFENFAGNNSPYATFAGLNIGAFKHFKKDFIGSQKWYDHVSNHSSGSQELRNLADLLKIKSMIDNDANITESIKLLENYLDIKPTFNSSARELLAILYIKDSKYEEAQKVLNLIITDVEAPSTIKDRAEQLISLTSR